MGRPRVERVKVQCAGCGAEIEKYPQQIEQNKTGRFVCSTACRKKVGPKPRRREMISCEWCHEDVYPRRGGQGYVQRFCSRRCHDLWQARNRVERTCEVCGVKFDRPPSFEIRQPARFCSRSCEASSRIKRPLNREHNGKPAVLDSNGYVRVYEPDHPRATKGGWVYEHRLIVERRIGRYLEPAEHVHHANGCKDDNRSENLVVMDDLEHLALSSREYREELDAMKA